MRETNHRLSAKIDFESYDAVLAIGDIHGCFGKLRTLVEKFEAEVGLQSKKAVVCLGDFVDRGPHSSAVLDWLLAKQINLDKFALRGNHEDMMASFLARPTKSHPWLKFGGLDTIKSYGLSENHISTGLFPNFKAVLRSIPDQHQQYLNELPHLITMGGVVFCHAGYDANAMPDQQDPQRLIWGPMCQDFQPSPFGDLLVHGHDVIDTPKLENGILNIDTGAYMGRPLSGLIFREASPLTMIQV